MGVVVLSAIVIGFDSLVNDDSNNVEYNEEDNDGNDSSVILGHDR